jgi:Pacifastin inhibitor (LCMII)
MEYTCNTCTCTVDGTVACTEMACAPVDTCLYNKWTYYLGGDTFCSTDGCNACTCSEFGSVTCTELACITIASAYGEQKYNIGDVFDSVDGCNACTCSDNGAIAFTELACLGGGHC